MRGRLAALAVLVTAVVAAAPAVAQADPWDFVTRGGSQLMLDGHPFRFSGANIEWLGLVGYGPLNFQPGQNERFPTEYEVNDALATAKEMGASVVRAQTLGDTVGCANCLEPALNQYNAQAFRVMDYAIMRARYYGIRLILEFQGDSRAVNGGNTSTVFSDWEGGADFWTDATVIKDFENHIEHVVDHVNSYTGIPYKDDPTILGWMDCNECSVDGAPDSWVTTINDYVKSLGPKQLIISDAPSVAPDTTELSDPNIDAFTAEVYPHWVPEGAGDRATGEDPWIHAAAKLVTSEGKVWFAAEVGWDPTNWLTDGDLQTFLTGIEQDPNISGDLFWALEGHANGHGWTPVPADSNCVPSVDSSPPPSGVTPPPEATTPAGGVGCQVGEDGSWWALYYTGIDTASNTAADMAARARILRAHAYAIRGLPVPPHMIPPAPIITQTDGGRLYWEGSAGAENYSIEQAPSVSGPWTVSCDQCVTDLSNGWAEPSAGACYRVVPFNLGGVAGPASAPAGAGDGCEPISGTEEQS